MLYGIGGLLIAIAIMKIFDKGTSKRSDNGFLVGLVLGTISFLVILFSALIRLLIP